MRKGVFLGVLAKSTCLGSNVSETLCYSRKFFIQYLKASVEVRRFFVTINIQKKQPFTLVQPPRKPFYLSVSRCSTKDDSVVESEYSIETATKDMDFSDEDSDLDEESTQLRKFLFPNSQDPVILKLIECPSIQSVIDVVVDHEKEFNSQHACQALVVLWDLQKLFSKINLENNFEILNSDPLYFQNHFKSFIDKVTNHEIFQKIISTIENSVHELSPDAACCAFLYLSRMKIAFDIPVMQKLLYHIESLFDNLKCDFPLTALSRFTVSLYGTSHLRYIYTLQKSVPIIISKIDKFETEDELILLTVCLRNIRILIDPEKLNLFKCKIEMLMKTGFFDTASEKLIVKLASFLNYPYWSEKFNVTSKNILLLLKGRTSNLSPREIIRLQRILQNQLEPAFLIQDLGNQASNILSRREENMLSFFLFTSLLSFFGYFSSLRNKSLENIIVNQLQHKLEPNSMDILYRVLLSLKFSNFELLNLFWSKYLQVIKENPEQQVGMKLIRNAQRYMEMNICFYRHAQYENYIIECLLQEYENGFITMIPLHFVRMLTFLVAFNDRLDKGCFGKIRSMITKLKEISPQIREVHCFYLSEGIRGALQWHSTKIHMFDIFVELESIIKANIERLLLENKNYPIGKINVLMRSYLHRKESPSTHLFNDLVSRYENVKDPVNSRIIRDAVHNLLSANYLVPNAMNTFAQYILNNKEFVIGETTELVLSACHNFGYIPEQANEFVEAGAEIIVRESYRMSGLSILKASLALCFFRKLPEKLVNLIFGIEFLERLDEEIANSKHKIKYPSNIRHYLMQLNRAVCVDCPEYDVPWFHKKYCEEIAATTSKYESQFFKDVRTTLCQVLGSQTFLKEVTYSPYGHKIDFVVLLNSKQQPVTWKHHSDKNISRIAVMLLKDDDFTKNVKNLKGFHQMNRRHLEILGYKIVQVLETHWNSMFMSEPGMKFEFISDRIFNISPERICSKLL